MFLGFPMSRLLPWLTSRRVLRPLFLTVMLSLLFPVVAAELLNNESIKDMARMGLRDDIVLAKIKAGPTRFDTRTEALADLQKANISSAVISAMIEAGSPPAAPAVAASPFVLPGHATTSGSESQFYAGPEDRLHRIEAVKVTREFSRRKAWIPYYGAFAQPEVFVFLSGATAQNAVDGADQVFRTSLDPLHLRLVHLGLHKRRKDRFIVFQGSHSDREIQFDTARDDTGLYTLTPRQALPSGEYAFLYNPNSSAGGFWSLFAQESGTAFAFDFSAR